VSTYDTVGRRNQVAADARQTVQTQLDNTLDQQNRGLSRAGIALDSGRALTLRQNAGFAAAKASAGADRAARQQVEDRGIQLVDNAARFGRNQTATALSAGGQSTAATGTASGIGATGNSVFQSQLNPALNLYGAAGSSAGQAASIYGNQANLLAQQAAQQQAQIGQMASTAGRMYAASSKKLKTRKRPLRSGQGLAHVEDAKVLRESAGSGLNSAKPRTAAPTVAGLNKTPVERWKYKQGVADEGEHVGPYAEDVQREFGDEVAPGGQGLNMGRMADVNQRAVQELSSQLDEIERKLGKLEEA